MALLLSQLLASETGVAWQNPESAPETFWSSVMSRYFSTFPMLFGGLVKQQNFQMKQDFLKMKD